MKKFLLGTVALIALSATAPAVAADLAARPYTKAPPFVAASPIYNWTGFYIGGHVGAGFGVNNNFGGNDARFIGGGQIGYDYQFSPNFVFGLEANYSFMDTSNGNGIFNANANPFANRGLGSVTGRLGYAFGPALLYVKGGYAYADTRFTNGFAGGNSGNGRDGYTVGGGLEYLFTQNFSGKIEYQYYDFGTRNFTFNGILVPGGVKNEEQTVKVGLNYRFNLGNYGGPSGGRY
jgi:outer membrane immunogenic protein